MEKAWVLCMLHGRAGRVQGHVRCLTAEPLGLNTVWLARWRMGIVRALDSG